MSRANVIWATGILIVCGFGLLGTLLLWKSPAAGTAAPNRVVWAKQIASNAVGTYDEFKKNYADAPFATQHESAHIIGAVLYESKGIGGILICDESFAFGCYHGFFGRVIADKGTSIIPELAENCRGRFGAQSTGCEHGIGHAIMEYTGRTKLLEALELCEQTKQANELYGCTSGLFMEYNSSMVFKEGVAYSDLRPFDTKDPLAPCDSSVPTPYRTSCYFEIGLWWKGQLGTDYEKIGNLCAKADLQTERDACYRGWGTVVAESVDHNPAEAKRVCDLIHDSSGAAVCALGVASRFFPAGYPQAAQEICTTLSGSLARECLSLSPANTTL